MERYNKAHRDWQREYLTKALTACDNSVIKAAKLTGINRTHFYKMMRKLGMDTVRVVPGRKVSTANRGNAAWQELGRASA